METMSTSSKIGPMVLEDGCIILDKLSKLNWAESLSNKIFIVCVKHAPLPQNEPFQDSCRISKTE